MIERKDLIDKGALRWWMTRDSEQVYKYLHKYVVNRDDPKRRHIYAHPAVGHGKALIVASIDSFKAVSGATFDISDNVLRSTSLHRRLGSYITCKLCSLGVSADILLVDKRPATWQSTAVAFNTQRRYNFVVELTSAEMRASTNGCTNGKWKKALEAQGLDVNQASSMSMCDEMQLAGNPARVQIGLGYKDAYQQAYVDLDVLVERANAVANLIDQYGNRKFDRQAPSRRHTYRTTYVYKPKEYTIYECECGAFLSKYALKAEGKCPVCDATPKNVDDVLMEKQDD